MNIGFVSTRLAGTDGVSLETAKLTAILTRMGHQVFYCAGKLDPEGPPGLLAPEMHFAHPRARRIHDEAFAGPTPDDLRERVYGMAAELREILTTFVDRFSIEVLFPQNALAIPMHLPLGVALTEFIAETHIPTIAHHHDLYWERPRLATTAVPDVLERCFPPDLPSVRHLVINSLAQAALWRRRGISARVLPNVFDFETPPPTPDPFSADLRGAMGLDPDDRLILQPTRVVPRKGIELSIELLRRLGDPRCRLLITHPAGDEGMGYLHRLQDLADRSGVDLRYVADRFGPARRMASDGVKTYNLWDAYLHADFVTYPSLIEGFGNALLESIYFHLPVLVNRYPVYTADIGPLGFDFVEIEGAITDEAVAHVRHLLDDADRRREATERNFALAREHFSYAVAERCLREVLRSLR
ncbi:MAG TPA: glycosyl transferase family 1 [Anaerolineae bacterium]|nr:glycosyl transferase family 1 [Anaerolineae bacterium]